MICTRVIEEVKDYQSAIKMTCDILEEKGAVNHTYYQAILDNIEKYGGYFYLGKGICMPHARIVKNKVRFFNNQVRVFITIAAKGEMEHFKNLHRIANFCNDEEKMKRLEEIKDEKELLELIGE